MKDNGEYRFVIDAYSPETLPMSRLAEYMADLAQLLGRAEKVHFVRLEAGSTVLVQRVDPEGSLEVRSRVRGLADNTAPTDATRAFRALNRRLADDNATGSLQEGGAEVVPFPGRDQPQPLTFGAFNQPGVLDGVLIRVGGQGDTVTAHLRDGEVTHICNATRDMARQLAVHLYGPTLRVQGEGRWEREADGGWLMKRFKIARFEELEGATLGDVVERLHTVEGSGWKGIDAPAEELRSLRGIDEAH